MNVVNDIFFELLQVAIGNRQGLSRVPTPEEWEEIYEMSKKQSLTGIAFAGVERLPQEQMPPGRRIRQWAVKAEKIREQNARVSEDCRLISRFFEKNGFDCVILKGQGNFDYYPEWLQGLRTAGDIDVWARPKGNDTLRYDTGLSSLRYVTDGDYDTQGKPCYGNSVRAVIEFCLSKKRGEYVYYHNMDFPVLKETPVEVHYRPTWLYNPFRNRKLQRYFASRREQEFKGYEGYRIPSVEFNVVFQLLHLYKHIFEEGIGLRQLVDYYFVVTKYDKSIGVKGVKDNTRDLNSITKDNLDNRDNLELIRKLGLEGFAGAVMYVMREVFAMPEERMLWEPDEKRGEKLLREIMIGGNFGKFDERYNWAETTNGSMDYRGASYAIARLRHNMQFLKDYPSEVLWEPVFRVYHWVWRKFKLWRFE